MRLWLEHHLHRTAPNLPGWRWWAGQLFSGLGLVVLAIVMPVLPVVAHQSQHITVPAGFFLLAVGAFLRGEPLGSVALNKPSSMFLFFMGLLLVFAFVSSVWAPLPLRGVGVSLSLFGLLRATLLGLYGLRGLHRLPCAWVVVAGVFVAALVFLVEARSGLALRRFLGLRAELFSLNRGAVGLALLAPFALLLGWRLGLRTGCLLLGAAVLGAVLALSSATAVLLFVVSCALLLLAGLWPRALGAGLCGMALVVLMTAPWLFAAVKPLLHEVGGVWLKGAHVQERLLIWEAFGQLLQSYTPVFGFGLESSWSPQLLDALPTSVLHDLTGLQAGHPHQFFLQVWFELGLVGVGFCVGLFVLIGFLLWAKPQPERTLLLGQVLLVMSISHGAWQAWWWASVGLAFWLSAFMAQIDEAYT
jgi:O-antigen ligase